MSALNSDIHRYLDDVFSGAAITPDLQDLKEELRGSLMARVADLQASGATPAVAAAAAIDELGDVRELIAEVETEVSGGPGTAARASGGARASGSIGYQNLIAELRRNRVRPRPAYVLRTVLLSLVLAAAVTAVTLCSLGVLAWPAPLAIAIAIIAGAIPVGVIVGDGVRQETTQNYPLPVSRAVRFGLASGVGLTALALIGLYPHDLGDVWLLIAGLPLAIVSVLLFVWLGVTQTNRKKQWVVAHSDWADDRFSQDPAAAARFGIYTAIIWVVAFAVFIVLSFTIGFAWSWIALLAGFALFFFVLARMLFPVDRPAARKDDDHV
jgi:hypothetical protein